MSISITFSDMTLIWPSSDNAEAVDGMPVGLQLIGRRLEEEKVLAMTATVLEALK